jgi:Uncharacterized protein conserved in bacteria (DUF2059)
MQRLIAATLLTLAMLTQAAAASPKADALIKALAIPDVLAVMQDEGKAYGIELEDGMFPGQGGANWAAAVARIYAADRGLPIFATDFAAALEASGADVDAMVAFFESDTGRKAVALEVSARRALIDEAVEEASRLKLSELEDMKDARLAAVERFIAANDLIDSNVMGGLNANLAFYQGLSAAGAFPEPMSEAEMLEDVWSQEPALRTETEVWLKSFLVMAYAPLSDAELEAYTAFSLSEPGQDLNAALFAGFDRLFMDVSRQLGTAAAGFAAGQDL